MVLPFHLYSTQDLLNIHHLPNAQHSIPNFWYVVVSDVLYGGICSFILFMYFIPRVKLTLLRSGF